MNPAPFRYYRARSLQEALDLLNGAAANGKLLAGGQSLIPLLNLRLARPEALIQGIVLLQERIQREGLDNDDLAKRWRGEPIIVS